MSKEYYVKRNQKNIETLRNIIHELPYFCHEFFLGIENRTAVLTRLGYAYDLRIFFDFLSREIEEFHGMKNNEFDTDCLAKITPTHLEMYLQYLSYYEFNGSTYTNDECAKARKLSTVKTMFKYFFKKEKLASNVADKVELPKLHHKEIIRLEDAEIVDFLDEVDSGASLSRREQAFHVKTRQRDTAIVTLLLGTGIRISECVGLNIEDFDFKNGSVKIVRKGGGESILYLSDEVIEAVTNYIDGERRSIVANDEITIKKEDINALFLSGQHRRMCVRAVQVLVKKYAQKVTPLKHITPHKLRSTYGTSLYRETKDIYIVADVLGHKDVNTTKKHYAAISDDIRKQAANMVKLKPNAIEKKEDE